MIIRGLCVSNGNAQGIVYNTEINGHVEFPVFSKDTIIVTRVLDRTILKFINHHVKGIIAERGSIGSHTAGNLRAMNIPCILRLDNITSLLSNGMSISIIGEDNCIVVPDECIVKQKSFESTLENWRYESIKEGLSNISDITPINHWYILRPNRKYEKLRYDIIKDSFTQSSSFLFGLEAKVRQNKDGVLEVFGIPDNMDLCKFYLKNPSWVIKKAKESKPHYNRIRSDINSLVPLCQNQSYNNSIVVFEESINSLRALYKYMLLAQTTSDEIIEIYLDFVNMLTKDNNSRDICNLYSDYILQDLTRKNLQGGYLSWGENVYFSPICLAKIDYSGWKEDQSIINAINKREIHERNKLIKDYSSFRTIVPLLYQLSEEFAHFSKGINSFLAWSISSLSSYLVTKDKSMTVERVIHMDLDTFRNIVMEYRQLL